MTIDKNKVRKKYWTHVLLWVGFIYSTLYIVRPICEFLKQVTPFFFLTNLLMIGLLAYAVIVLWFQIGIRSVSSFVLLALVLSAYLYGLIVISYPEEKIHFVEYGILAYLIYRALSLDTSKVLTYTGAFLLTSAFGWIDEGIQHILPNRYYQNADVLLNSVSGLLGLILVYIFQREIEKKKILANPTPPRPQE